MKNKLLAMLLCGAMAVTVLGGCGNSAGADEKANDAAASDATVEREEKTDAAGETEDDKFSEKLTIEIGGYGTTAAVDYDGPYLGFWEDKFNVDFDVLPNEWDAAEERISLAVTGGTLYDVTLWLTFDWASYYSYVDQGLLKALPEGWEEKWPNIYKMVEASGLKEYLEVDGELYAIPKAVYVNLIDPSYATRHTGVYYRQDWAEQIGMPELVGADTMTLSQFKQYLEGVKEAGLSKYPFGSEGFYLRNIFSEACGVAAADMVDEGDGYTWIPTQEGFSDMLDIMQEWYREGLLDPDVYSVSNDEYGERFFTGQTAALAANANDVNGFWNAFESAQPDKSGPECVGTALITDDNGVFYANEVANYWLTTIYSPDIDDAVFERVLDITDWGCSVDGMLTYQLGIPEVDWTYGDDGKPVVLESGSGKIAALAYPDQLNAINLLFGYCGDEYSLCGYIPAQNQEGVAKAKKLADIRSESYIFPYAFDFQCFFGDSKITYNGAINVVDFIMKVVCGTEDVDTMVDNYVEENRAVWEPLLADVNEFAGY